MTVDTSWTARVVHPRELGPSDIELWSAFRRRDESLTHPFFAFAFARAADRVHPHVFVAVLEHQGRTVGFLPFQFLGPLPMMMRAAERVGASLADRFGVIAGDDLGLGAAELLALARLNSLSFSFLPAEQRRHGFSGQREVAGQRVILRGDETSFWAALKATSRKFASQVERNERLVAKELGPLRMTFQADAGAELPRLIELKRAQYRRTGGDDPLAVRWTTDLFWELLRSPDPQCTAVLSTLHAGDTWLASHLGVMSETVFHYWFPVYSPDWARFSPGHILTKYLILAALSAGAGSFDLAGYGQYKDHFRPESYAFDAGFWQADGLGGFVNKVAKSLSWRVEGLKRRHKERLAAAAQTG
jgi:CelD/BcsL family acetyltransferase involved in cellulose biosynthesis